MTNVLKSGITVVLIVFIVLFLANSGAMMKSFVDGVTLWAFNVLPALFPFSVFSSVLVGNFQPKRQLKLTQKLFAISNAETVLLASFLCGYPVGAKCISNLYDDGKIDSAQATQLTTFCSTAGPVFVLGTIAKLTSNTKIATLILLSHWLSALLSGVIFRKAFSAKPIERTSLKNKSFGDVLTDSVLSVLTVGGLIALFYMIGDFLRSALTLPPLLSGFLLGLVEMSCGVIAVCQSANAVATCVLCSAILSFGGVCVALQSLAFLSKCGVSAKHYFAVKITQCALATVTSYALALLFLH